MTYAYPYPASLDSFGVKVDNTSTVLATGVNYCQNAVAALQLLVGRDNSTNDYSLDYLVGDFFDDGTIDHQRHLWFYMSAAPTGWSLSGLATNCVVGVKGGTGYWNVTGGQYVSDWGWTVADMNNDIHSHCWYYYDYSAGSPYHWTYDTDGVTLKAFEDDSRLNYFCGASRGKVGNMTNTNKDRNRIIASKCYTDTDSHDHDMDGNWRPKAACGILAKYTGS